jgi:ferredoxin
MLIQVARGTCIGAAPCVAIAGDVFQLDAEGKVIIVGEITDEAKIRLAAESCPVRAIYLYDDNKNQIYPPPEENPRPYQEN